MSNRQWPMTGDELRQIADRVDEVLIALEGDEIPDGDWRWGLTVEIYDDAGEVVGQIKPYGDGWLGFYPKEIA